MKFDFSTLKCDFLTDSILRVMLNRPESHNAINSVMMYELQQFWLQVKNIEGLRCIILTGSGEKAFCAGADLKERKDLDVKTWMQQHGILQQAMRAMLDCEIPIIAAVNGVAYGGGLELTLACDFAYAATNAVFAQSEVKWGIMPGAMGTQNLPRALGLRRAKEVTLTAEAFTADQAFEWGLVNKVISFDTLMPEVIKTAETIANNAPLAVRNAKKAMNFSQGADLKKGYEFEVHVYNQLLNTADRVEGVKAFNEKRKAIFKGE